MYKTQKDEGNNMTLSHIDLYCLSDYSLAHGKLPFFQIGLLPIVNLISMAFSQSQPMRQYLKILCLLENSILIGDNGTVATCSKCAQSWSNGWSRVWMYNSIIKNYIVDFSFETLLLSADQNEKKSIYCASDCISFVFLSILDKDPTHNNHIDHPAND